MEAHNAEKTERLLPQYERNIPESFGVRFIAQGDWGFWETAAFYLGGVGAGLYVVSQFLNVRTGLIVGFLLVVIFKNIAHLLSASRPARGLRAFANPRTSWISRGAYFIAFFTVFGALDIALRLGWMMVGGVVFGKIISLLTLFFASMIMIYIGFVMAQSRAMPLWHTPLLPLMLLTYSLAMGSGAGFLMLLFDGAKEEFVFCGRWFVITAGLSLLTLITEVLLMMTSGKAARFSVRILTSGKVGVMFVGGSLIAGLLVPLALAGYGLIVGGFSQAVCFFIGGLALAGGFMFETALLSAGVYTPLIDAE